MRKKSLCPRCGSSQIAKILYGEPDFSPELARKLKSGEIVLGSCLVSPDNPQWKCTDCTKEWRNKSDEQI